MPYSQNVDNPGENVQNKSAETVSAEVVVKGDEFGEYKDIKELRTKAESYYKEHLQGTSVSNPIFGKVNLTNTNIDFTGKGISKAISTSAKKNKLLLIKHLPELIQKAEKVRARANVKNKRSASQYTYLTTSAVIDGKERIVEITIFTDVNGTRYYNHILPQEENNKRSLSVYPAQAPENGNGIPAVRQQAPVNPNIPRGQEKVNGQPNTEQAQSRSDNQGGFSDGDTFYQRAAKSESPEAANQRDAENVKAAMEN